MVTGASIEMGSPSKEEWFSSEGGGASSARLFCFPYAGGSSGIYRGWSELFPNMEICVARLPGREARFKEPAMRTNEEVVRAMSSAIRPLLDRPFVLFGHSMGALLAFELARELREQALRSPRLLCVSAAPAPHLPRRAPALSRMSNEQLVAELRTWNGTPEAILTNRELMHLLLPTIRADLEVVEGYTYRALPPLQCPLLVLGGKQDRSVARDDLIGWGEHTIAGSNLVEVDGDHFFLHSADALGTVKASIESLHRGEGRLCTPPRKHADN